MTEESLNCSGKTPVFKDRLTIFVIVGRSAGRHCFRIEVGIGSKSQKELDDCEMILLISSLVAGRKQVRLVGRTRVQCEVM